MLWGRLRRFFYLLAVGWWRGEMAADIYDDAGRCIAVCACTTQQWSQLLAQGPRVAKTWRCWWCVE